MNVKLKTTREKEVLVNWNNVDFAKESESVYGDAYVEIHFGKQCVDVRETLEEIENLTNTQN